MKKCLTKVNAILIQQENQLTETDHRLDILFLERKKGNPIQSSIHPSSQTWTRMHSQRRKAHKERKSSSTKFMQKWEKITFRQWRRPLSTHPLNLKSPKIQKKLALHRKKELILFRILSNTHNKMSFACVEKPQGMLWCEMFRVCRITDRKRSKKVTRRIY